MIYYLSLGANIGEREQTLMRAIELMQQRVGELLKTSSFYYSEPWGFESEYPFCNLCCSFRSDLEPMDFLLATQAIERELGRTAKSTNGYQDRVIDIDIIRVYDREGKEIHLALSRLTVPHPLWQQRDFVKIPLAEILAPER